MPPPLVWVNKTAASKCLTQSAADEDTLIRRQAQLSRNHGTLFSDSAQRSTTQPAVSSDDPNRSITSSLQSVDAVQPLPVDDHVMLHRPQGVPFECPQPEYTLREGVELTEIERRSLDFFRRRTAQDWVGWQDADFWSSAALQLSHGNKALAHGLVALSALHEGLEYAGSDPQRSRSLMKLSLMQRDKTIFIAASSNLTHPQALASCIVLLCIHNLQHGHHSFRLLRAGLRILEEYDGINHFCGVDLTAEASLVNKTLRPMLEQLAFRLVTMVSAAKALENSIMQTRSGSHTVTSDGPMLDMPDHLVSLHQARDLLQEIFDWCYKLLVIGDGSTLSHKLRPMLSTWEAILDSMHQPQDSSQAEATASKHLLIASSIYCKILIETFQTTTEMVFDNYLSDFEQLIHRIEQAQSHLTHSHSKTTFGTDGGLVDIIAYAGRHCRDSHLRRRALNLLLHGGRVEGGRLALTAGVILQKLIELEERHSPRGAASEAKDIEACDRVQIWRGSQYFRLRKIQLVVCRAPFDPALGAHEEIVWVSLPDKIKEVNVESMRGGAQLISDLSTPDTIMGSGYVAFLEDRKSKQYYVVEKSRYVWPIPRI